MLIRTHVRTRTYSRNNIKTFRKYWCWVMIQENLKMPSLFVLSQSLFCLCLCVSLFCLSWTLSIRTHPHINSVIDFIFISQRTHERTYTEKNCFRHAHARRFHSAFLSFFIFLFVFSFFFFCRFVVRRKKFINGCQSADRLPAAYTCTHWLSWEHRNGEIWSAGSALGVCAQARVSIYLSIYLNLFISIYFRFFKSFTFYFYQALFINVSPLYNFQLIYFI